MQKTSRRVRRLRFETLEPRIAPDAVLTGTALLGAAVADRVEADFVAGSAIEVSEISVLPDGKGLVEGIEQELARLDSEALRLQTADRFAEIFAETERKSPNLDLVDDAKLIDFAVYASLIKGVLDGDLHGTLLFGNRPLEPLPHFLASTGGSEAHLDSVGTSPKFYSAVDGGSGSLWAALSGPQESPPFQVTVTFSVDGGGAGITLNDPVQVVTMPPFASPSTGMTVAPGTAAGAYDARVTLDDGQTGTVPFYVVEVDDFDVHYQKPDTNWAAPDTSLVGDPSVPVLWSHDTLRWRPTSGTGFTPLDPSPSPPALPPIAIAGDWDGDGIVTGGLLEPQGSDFLLRNLNHSGPADVAFGFGPDGAGWDPIAGDWDGDGDATVGFFDPVGGTFYLQNENVGGAAEIVFRFGPLNSGWAPIAGDWDGDGDTNVGLYDEAAGNFHLIYENLPGPADVTVRFGPSGSLGWSPLAGDWDSDGDANLGLYDEAAGNFHLIYENLPGPADVTVRYGPSGSLGWLPLAGDWDGDGDGDLGLYDGASGNFHLRTELAPGPADITLNFGPGNSQGEDPVAVQMMARPWDAPAAPWQEFAFGFCSAPGCEAFGNPGVGDWAIMPWVWYGGGPAGQPQAVVAKMQQPKRIVVAEVESLVWQESMAIGPGELGGGDLVGNKFFPDAEEPKRDFRRRVDLVITTVPNHLSLEVVLSVFDVDDPTDADGPIDVDPMPNGGINNVDNNGGSGWLDEISVVVTGQATVAFFAPLQPGDNLRVAAGGRDSELEQVIALAPDPQSRLFLDTIVGANATNILNPGEPIIDENNPAGGVHTTPTLTIWRRLHVEVDSMAPVTGNTVTGSIIGSPQDLENGTANVMIQSPVNPVDSTNRFENGTLTQNGMNWDVISSEATGQGDFAIIIDIFDEGDGGGPGGGDPGGPIPLPVPGPFQSLVDDDFYQDGANIPTPLYEELIPAMADAFIEVFITEDNPNVPFNLNVETTEFSATLDWDTAPKNSNSWWVAYVLAGHQGPKDGASVDNDPETEIPALLGKTDPGHGGSITYLETIRDRAADSDNNWDPVLKMQENVVHEVGHAVSGQMETEPVTTYPDAKYTEVYLDLIRKSLKPVCCPPSQP